ADVNTAGPARLESGRGRDDDRMAQHNRRESRKRPRGNVLAQRDRGVAWKSSEIDYVIADLEQAFARAMPRLHGAAVRDTRERNGVQAFFLRLERELDDR